MADGGDDRMEALSRTIGAGLIQMGKEVEALSKKSKDASSEGGGLKQMDNLFVGMTKNLAGPVGLAAAIYAVGKSLENLAVGRLQLQNFSRDTGATVPMINAMSEALKKAGISAEAGQQSVGRLAQLVQGLAAEGFGSELGKLLLETGRSANEIQTLIDTAKTNTDKAMLDTVDILRRGNAQYQSYVSQRTGLFQSHLQAMKGTQAEMNKVYVSDAEAAQRWHDDWSIIGRGIGNTWEAMADRIRKAWASTPNIGKVIEELNKRAAAGGGGFEPHPNSIIGRMLPGGKGFGDDDGGPFLDPRRIPGRVNQLMKLLPKGAAVWPDPSDGASFDERFGKATDFSGRSRTQELVAKGLAAYQSGVDWINSSSTAPSQDDRKKSMLYRLHEQIKPPDIESILDQMIPVNPLLFMKHMAQQYSGGSSGSFSDRFSAIWDKSGGSATDLSSRQKADDLIAVGKDSAKTLLDIRDILQGNDGGGGGYGYGGGASDPGGMRRALSRRLGMDRGGSRGGGGGVDGSITGQVDVSEADKKGINRDKWLNALQNDPAMRERLYRHALGENTDPLANQAVMEEAANRADIRGNKSFDDNKNLSYFQGYYGGTITPKMRKMLDSNFAKVFAGGSDISVGAIDNSSQWLSAKHERTGRFRTTANYGGDRITGHPGVESFEVPGWGESGTGERARYPEFRRQQLEEAERRRAARNAMDQAQSPSQQSRDASMSATIDFKNMPSWVRSSVDSNGVFKDLRVTRSTPQAGKASSPQGDLQNWSYE